MYDLPFIFPTDSSLSVYLGISFNLLFLLLLFGTGLNLAMVLSKEIKALI